MSYWSPEKNKNKFKTLLVALFACTIEGQTTLSCLSCFANEYLLFVLLEWFSFFVDRCNNHWRKNSVWCFALSVETTVNSRGVLSLPYTAVILDLTYWTRKSGKKKLVKTSLLYLSSMTRCQRTFGLFKWHSVCCCSTCRVWRDNKLAVNAHRCELRKARKNSEVIQVKLIQLCSKTVLWSIFEYALGLKCFQL